MPYAVRHSTTTAKIQVEDVDISPRLPRHDAPALCALGDVTLLSPPASLSLDR